MKKIIMLIGIAALMSCQVTLAKDQHLTSKKNKQQIAQNEKESLSKQNKNLDQDNDEIGL